MTIEEENKAWKKLFEETVDRSTAMLIAIGGEEFNDIWWNLDGVGYFSIKEAAAKAGLPHDAYAMSALLAHARLIR